MLTRKQKDFYDGLVKMVEERGYFPSVREIGEALGFSSSATVHTYLTKMIHRGLVERRDGAWSLINQNRGVPLAGLVPAGSPFEIFEDLGEEIEVPAWMGGQEEGVVALRVRGDSMKDAHICDGDVVLIRRRSAADPGSLVIAVLPDHSITLKRYSRRGGKAWLIPENPDYEPIPGPFEVAGTVIGVLRQYR